LLCCACGSGPTGPWTYLRPSDAGSASIAATLPLDDRARDITVDSPAMGRRVQVRLLLPARFDAEPGRRWPVLYLLHGCCDSYQSWTGFTDVERLTAGLGVIVAMPEGGAAGFYSDWRAGPRWETFHTVELPELLATSYRTSDRSAIAGVSMGGLGALSYAARHPGEYAAAASFSGIVDTRRSDETSRGYLDLVRSQGEDPTALWGDPDTDAEVWAEHNPYDLAPQLAGIPLFISAGDGQPGPLDSGQAGADTIEPAIRAENAAFAQRLVELGIDAQVDLYGPGTHNWVYWQRELDRALPLLTRALGVEPVTSSR
jgi:S-formylglutathione hydrolase FrmB